MRLSAALSVLLVSTCSCPSQAESKRPVYLSSIAAPLPVAVPGIRPTVPSPQYSKHFEQGLSFKKAGDNNRALIEFLQAIKENPRCTRAFYEQALLFRQKGYPKLAESSLCQALAVDPSFRDARILLAAVRLEAGNTGGAAQELTRSLGLPSSPASASASSPSLPSVPASKSTSLVTPPVIPLAIPSTHSPQQTLSTPLVSAPRKSGLQFIPEGTAESGTNSNASSSKIAASQTKQIDTDDWAKRLKYLSIHGTGTLKPGEAFMFSEETGEAVIFLTNGTRIRRIISAPQDTHELVKARRPDMLIPADLLYKLSTLGKLVAGDPSALIDTSASENPEYETAKKKEYFDADLDSEDQQEDAPAKRARKNKPEKGTLGDLMDSNEDDNADNKFIQRAILEDSPRDKPSTPIIPNDATKGPRMDSTEPSSMKDFNKDPVNDSLIDKTQKFFGWFKKALHLP
ncbi:MAG: tetratricopeptide repeat protein [Candidatus Obscuribacterales bacterium]